MSDPSCGAIHVERWTEKDGAKEREVRCALPANHEGPHGWGLDSGQAFHLGPILNTHPQGHPTAMELARLDREIVKLRNALFEACKGWNEARSGTDLAAERRIVVLLGIATGTAVDGEP